MPDQSVPYVRSPGVVTRRREPAECPAPLTAIRNHCLECCGWQLAETKKCTAPKCWLWPYRMGHDPVLSQKHSGRAPAWISAAD